MSTAFLIKDDPTKFYNIIEKMGAGSYGTVFKATRKKDNKEVAMKMVNKSMNEGGIDEVIKEIKFLQTCSNPNIVQYYESYEVGDYIWVCF